MHFYIIQNIFLRKMDANLRMEIRDLLRGLKFKVGDSYIDYFYMLCVYTIFGHLDFGF